MQTLLDILKYTGIGLAVVSILGFTILTIASIGYYAAQLQLMGWLIAALVLIISYFIGKILSMSEGL